MNRSVGSRIFLSKYREGVALKEEYLPRCHTIDGKIVGVIGSGNIGRQVTHLMQAFGATVQYYDAFRLSSQAEDAEGLTYKDLPELYCTSDIIILHVPLLPETEHMINREALALMESSAIIVNAARGGVICEADLYDALVSGSLSDPQAYLNGKYFKGV